MWCPSDLTYTIKNVFIWCDDAYQLKNILFVVTTLAYKIEVVIRWCDDHLT